MDIGSVSKSFVQLILLVASFVAGTFHSGSELPSSPPREYSVADTTYHFQLEGPFVHEATTSHELNSIVMEKSDETTITPILTNTLPILPTITPTETLKSIMTTIPTPTAKPSPTPTPTRPPATPTPTTSKPTKTPIPEATPTSEPSQITLNVPVTAQSDKPSLNSDVILQLINDHRATKKLSPLVKDGELCKLAEYRKPQLFDEIFTSGNVHKGLYDLKLPYYITENMAHYPSEQKVVSWWLGSHLHRSAIEGNYMYSCGACSGNSCAQLFTNYSPKSF